MSTMLKRGPIAHIFSGEKGEIAESEESKNRGEISLRRQK